VVAVSFNLALKPLFEGINFLIDCIGRESINAHKTEK
jgi:hypothetical protein